MKNLLIILTIALSGCAAFKPRDPKGNSLVLVDQGKKLAAIDETGEVYYYAPHDKIIKLLVGLLQKENAEKIDLQNKIAMKVKK